MLNMLNALLCMYLFLSLHERLNLHMVGYIHGLALKYLIKWRYDHATSAVKQDFSRFRNIYVTFHRAFE